MNSVFEYINYLWNAKGRHGTHSPFVYEFVDNCLRETVNNDFIKERNLLFESLKKNHNSITIQDFGVGSKRLSNERIIADIFNTSSSKGKFGKLLYQLSAYYKPKRILEFGTSLGIGSIHLSKGNNSAHIVTVEACEETHLEALKNFKQMNCENIESIKSTFDEFLLSYSGKPFDLVFIDGHHDGEALKRYLHQLDLLTHNDTIFILDDIRWSNSMLEAWKSIVASSKFHVTMDLFRMGIVLKREQQEKEHFTVKI